MTAGVKRQLSSAYAAFATAAEGELADGAGVQLRPGRKYRSTPTKTMEVPLLGDLPPVASTAGAALRWLHRRARELVVCSQPQHRHLRVHRSQWDAILGLQRWRAADAVRRHEPVSVGDAAADRGALT